MSYKLYNTNFTGSRVKIPDLGIELEPGGEVDIIEADMTKSVDLANALKAKIVALKENPLNQSITKIPTKVSSFAQPEPVKQEAVIEVRKAESVQPEPVIEVSQPEPEPVKQETAIEVHKAESVQPEPVVEVPPKVVRTRRTPSKK